MAGRDRWLLAGVLLSTGVLPGPVAATVGGAAQFAMARPLDASRPIGYFVGEGRGRTGFQPGDRQLAVWALEDWRRSSGNILRLEPAPEASALVRIYWADPDGGQYGEMQSIVVGGRAGAAVFVRPDMDALGPDIARRTSADALLRDTIVYLTCVHELGHALGFPHTRDFSDIMYFFGYGGDIAEYFGRYRAKLRSRNDIGTTSGLSAGDVDRLRVLYPVN